MDVSKTHSQQFSKLLQGTSPCQFMFDEELDQNLTVNNSSEMEEYPLSGRVSIPASVAVYNGRVSAPAAIPVQRKIASPPPLAPQRRAKSAFQPTAQKPTNRFVINFGKAEMTKVQQDLAARTAKLLKEHMEQGRSQEQEDDDGCFFGTGDPL